MEQEKYVQIYGMIKNKSEYPLAHTHIKLLQLVQRNGIKSYKEVQQGRTDKDGYYRFNIKVTRENIYKVIVVGEENDTI